MTDRNNAENVAHWSKLWDAGYEWALGLKVGARFLGSYGEAKARGLGGSDANAFHQGATSGLEGWKGIWTKGNSSKIIKLEAK